MKRFLNCLFKIVFGRTLVIILMVLLQILVLLGSFTWLRSGYPFIWESMSILGTILIIYIFNKDEPAEFKLSWIIPICLFPVLGALIYVFVIGNFGAIGQKAKLGRSMKETAGLLYISDETKEAIKDYWMRCQI